MSKTILEGLHPFTTAMMQAPMPEKKMPLGGSTDPDKHLRSFVNTMAFYSSSDTVWAIARKSS